MRLGMFVVGFVVVGVALLGRIEYAHLAEVHAKYSRALTDLAYLETDLDQYKTDYGDYPPTLAAMFADRDPGMIRPALPPAPRVARDPWGRPYLYESDGNTYVLGSFGPRGAGRGQASDLDLKLVVRSK